MRDVATTDNFRTYQQVNKVIETDCPTCEAGPGYACYAESPNLEHSVFHAARLMATNFGDD